MRLLLGCRSPEPLFVWRSRYDTMDSRPMFRMDMRFHKGSRLWLLLEALESVCQDPCPFEPTRDIDRSAWT